MYSVVLLAAMTAAPDAPQALLCPVNESRYGHGFWLKHCFYDCCAPARYGWVNCWTKGHGVYPGQCGPGSLYHPGACSCAPCGGGYSVGTACTAGGCNPCWGKYEWGIGNQPAYYTSVLGCPPHVTAPPYAKYTQCNPCCTQGHFAFDTGLIGHSHGVGYAGFGGYGNFGHYGAAPMAHPPTTADLPPFPRTWTYTVPRAPGDVPMPAIPGTGTPPFIPPATDKLPPKGPDVPPKGVSPVPPDSLLPKPPTVPPMPETPKGEPKADPKKAEADRPEPATVVLSVPAGATITVGGQALRSTGRERSFRTPSLAPGQDFVYQVRAVLMVGGVEEVEVKEVTVTAGLTSRASFEKLFALVERPAPALANGK